MMTKIKDTEVVIENRRNQRVVMKNKEKIKNKFN